MASYPTGLIERYRPFLPIPEDAQAVTLSEGGTSLVPLLTLSDSHKGISVMPKWKERIPRALLKTAA